MAKLKIQAPDGKTLVVDVTGYDPSEYDSLATSAVEDYMAKRPNPVPPPALDMALRTMTGSMNPNPPNVIPTAANVPAMTGKQAGEMVGEKVAEGLGEAGYPLTGAALGTAVTAIPETYKAFLGPDAIIGGNAMNAALAPLGSAVASVLSKWGEKMALRAAGIVGNVAKKIGSNNLPAIAQFLLNPVKLGTKELPPILTAGSSTSGMKAAAEAIRDAAGKTLETINPVMDKALAESPHLINLNEIIARLNELQATMTKYHPRAGNAVVKEFQKHIDDLKDVILAPKTSDNLFSALREFDTTLGDLIQNFDSNAPVKAAAQAVRGVVAEGLKKAASVADEASGALFAKANEVYTKIIPIIDALEGKVVKSYAGEVTDFGVGVLAGLFDPRAAIPAAIATRLGRAYGQQAVAAGLNTASKAIPPAISLASRVTPAAAKSAQSIVEGLKE